MAGSGWKEPLGPLRELRGGKRNELMVDSLVRRHFSIGMPSYAVPEDEESLSVLVIVASQGTGSSALEKLKSVSTFFFVKHDAQNMFNNQPTLAIHAIGGHQLDVSWWLSQIRYYTWASADVRLPKCRTRERPILHLGEINIVVI